MALPVRTIDGRTWRTPLTDQPLRTVRTARLKKTHYRGTYHNEGIGGFEFWRTGAWLPVVALQQKHGRRWKTWMVDDPVHWDGMREAVSDLPAGRVLVAGLGLGLMLHHMKEQPRFERITVVELNPDVVELILPTLPEDDRVEIVVGDFYEFLQDANGKYDSVLWDLAVGTPEQTFADLVGAQALVRMFMGGSVPLVQFGLRRTKRPPEMDGILGLPTEAERVQVWGLFVVPKEVADE